MRGFNLLLSLILWLCKFLIKPQLAKALFYPRKSPAMCTLGGVGGGGIKNYLPPLVGGEGRIRKNTSLDHESLLSRYFEAVMEKPFGRISKATQAWGDGTNAQGRDGQRKYGPSRKAKGARRKRPAQVYKPEDHPSGSGTPLPGVSSPAKSFSTAELDWDLVWHKLSFANRFLMLLAVNDSI